MPPKQAKLQYGRGNPDSRTSTSNETNENANFASDMQALANAVTAVQSSIDSFREEKQVSIASLHETLNVYDKQITNMEDGMNEFDKRLGSVETSQTLLAKENYVLKEKVAYLENDTTRHIENAEGPRLSEFITKLLMDVLGEDSFTVHT